MLQNNQITNNSKCVVFLLCFWYTSGSWCSNYQAISTC